MLSRLGSVVALTSMAALVLVGCSPPEPTETTPADPTAPSSEGAVLAQAESAWKAYQATLSQLAADPESATIEPLLAVATPDLAEVQFANIAQAAAVGGRAEGTRTTIAFVPTSALRPGADVAALVCIDTSNERLFDFEGAEVSKDPDTLLRSRSVDLQWQNQSDMYLVSSERAYDGPEDLDPCD